MYEMKEHVHDTRTCDPEKTLADGEGWTDIMAESIRGETPPVARRLRMVLEDTHLYRAVVNNVAARYPDYKVTGVFFCYYPDLLTKGIDRIGNVQVELSKRDRDWDDDDDDLDSIDYIIKHPTGDDLNADGSIKLNAQKALNELLLCPDCMYYELTHIGVLEYQPGREQTVGDVRRQEEAEEANW